jgi:hypothetical protein
MRILYLIRLSLPKQTRFGKMSCVDGAMEACLIDGPQKFPRPVSQVPRSGDLIIATHFRWRSWCGWLGCWFGKNCTHKLRSVSVLWFLKSRLLHFSNTLLICWLLGHNSQPESFSAANLMFRKEYGGERDNLCFGNEVRLNSIAKRL